jgi:hypothetical protein
LLLCSIEAFPNSLPAFLCFSLFHFSIIKTLTTFLYNLQASIVDIHGRLPYSI